MSLSVSISFLLFCQCLLATFRAYTDRDKTSLPRWTWVWASFRSWWWTGKPGVLQSLGSQRVGHDWGLNWRHYRLEYYWEISTLVGQLISIGCKIHVTFTTTKIMRMYDYKVFFFFFFFFRVAYKVRHMWTSFFFSWVRFHRFGQITLRFSRCWVMTISFC